MGQEKKKGGGGKVENTCSRRIAERGRYYHPHKVVHEPYKNNKLMFIVQERTFMHVKIMDAHVCAFFLMLDIGNSDESELI